MNLHFHLSALTLPCVVALVCCSSRPSSSLVDPDVRWLVYSPNAGHIVLVEDDGKGTDLSTHTYFLEIGEQGLPEGTALPKALVAATLQDSGRVLVLRCEGPITNWQFSTKDDSGTKINGSSASIAAIGISDLRSAEGWSMKAISESHASDGRDLLISTRQGGDPPPTPSGYCGSGGAGSSGCSSAQGSQSCSTTCRATHYACCGTGGVMCFCVRNGLPEPK